MSPFVDIVHTLKILHSKSFLYFYGYDCYSPEIEIECWYYLNIVGLSSSSYFRSTILCEEYPPTSTSNSQCIKAGFLTLLEACNKYAN